MMVIIKKKKLSGISTYMICDRVYDESFYGSIILIRRCDVYLLFFMDRNKYEYFSTSYLIANTY